MRNEFCKTLKLSLFYKILLHHYFCVVCQLSRVRDFKTCYLYLDPKLTSNSMTDELQMQLTKSFPIVTIGKSKLQMDKFKVTPFKQPVRSAKRDEQRRLMTCASGNYILIAVVAWEKKNPTFLSDLHIESRRNGVCR